MPENGYYVSMKQRVLLILIGSALLISAPWLSAWAIHDLTPSFGVASVITALMAMFGGFFTLKAGAVGLHIRISQ